MPGQTSSAPPSRAESGWPTGVETRRAQHDEARRQLIYELISGGSGLLLALFMWGHLILVGSILTGSRGFDWMAGMLETFLIAQPTVVVILAAFIVHALYAGRKIPARIRQRKQMLATARALRQSEGALRGQSAAPGFDPRFAPHAESLLWIWQVRTGLVILVLGSFHIGLLAVDVLTPLFGERLGIEASTSTARVAGGLWLPYAILLLCVEFHASVGLYRLAVKWGAGRWLGRRTLRWLELGMLWSLLGLGLLTLAVLAQWLPPPLAFLLPAP